MAQVSSPNVHGVTLDPICGITLDCAESVGPVVYRGMAYHFCSHRCQSRFFAQPPQDLQREQRLAIAFLGQVAATA